MPMHLTRSPHRVGFGLDPNPVTYGLVPPIAASLPLPFINSMPQAGRLEVSSQAPSTEMPCGWRSRRLDVQNPYLIEKSRCMIPDARGPVRPLEYGLSRRITECPNSPACPVAVPVGGRYAEFI